MLSGRDQCDGPIAGPEESYRVQRVLTERDFETSAKKRRMSDRAVETLEGRYETSYVTDRNVNKGKSVPLQAWSGPDGSSKLRFPDFLTMVQDGGKVVSLRHRAPLPPGNAPGTHFC